MVLPLALLDSNCGRLEKVIEMAIQMYKKAQFDMRIDSEIEMVKVDISTEMNP